MIYVLIGVLVVACDQAVKYLTRTMMRPGQSISVIGSFFRITYVKNSGAALGMLEGHRTILLIVPAVVIAAALLFIFLDRYAHPIVKLAVILIASGGVGNLIDRAAFGVVTDMFSFSIFPPVFNVADIAVTVGCALILVYVLFGEKLARVGVGTRKRKKNVR